MLRIAPWWRPRISRTRWRAARRSSVPESAWLASRSVVSRRISRVGVSIGGADLADATLMDMTDACGELRVPGISAKTVPASPGCWQSSVLVDLLRKMTTPGRIQVTQLGARAYNFVGIGPTNLHQCHFRRLQREALVPTTWGCRMLNSSATFHPITVARRVSKRTSLSSLASSFRFARCRMSTPLSGR